MTEKERGGIMERLTARNKLGGAYYPYCFLDDTCCGYGSSSKCDECDFTTKSCEKLAHYEDLAEQGRLLELPCEVGDMVYRLCGSRGNKYVAERKVGCITYRLNHKGEIVWEIFTTTTDVLGKKVFLTREEAQAALEKMKGE